MNVSLISWSNYLTLNQATQQITNYELGVIIPLDNAAQGDELACWKRPARQYVIGKDVPWVSFEYCSNRRQTDNDGSFKDAN